MFREKPSQSASGFPEKPDITVIATLQEHEAQVRKMMGCGFYCRSGVKKVRKRQRISVRGQ